MIAAKYGGAVKVFALALALAVGAGALLWVGANSIQVANEGRAKVPGTVEFDGEKRRYDVFLGFRIGQGSATPDRLVRNVRCTVAQDGDPYVEMDGARQGVRTVSEAGTSIGSFDGRAGRLSVSCEWDGRSGRNLNNRFIVAKQRTLTRSAGYGGLGVAGVLVVVGLLMVRRASRKP